ncbi:MAG: hypothetical protein HY901_27980 [Deltaproteobacteria bacterium]|nr:hypothetical protein [Deltaproteobacteria bacterium]
MSEQELAPLDPEIDALLDHERRRPAPSAEEQARLAACVDSTVLWLAAGGATAVGAAVGTAVAVGAGKPVFKWLAEFVAAHWKVGLVTTFVAGGVAGAGTQHVMEARSAAHRPAVVRAAAAVAVPPVAVEPAAPVVEAAPAPEVPMPKPPATVAPPAPKPHVPAVKESPPLVEEKPVARDVVLARERALVEAARTSLARGRKAEALESLQAHEQQFPAGVLAEERESLWVHLLLSDGASDAARERARRFHARFPKSMLWPSIQSALEESEKP